jgi:hypothetical protein
MSLCVVWRWIVCLCVTMIGRNYNDINAEFIYVCRPRKVSSSPSLVLVVTSPGLKMENSFHLFTHASGKRKLTIWMMVNIGPGEAIRVKNVLNARKSSHGLLVWKRRRRYKRRILSLRSWRLEEVYYESINRETKISGINKCRCDERLQTKTKEFTRLPYTGLALELEHLKIETRLISERFANAMGECEN